MHAPDAFGAGNAGRYAQFYIEGIYMKNSIKLILVFVLIPITMCFSSTEIIDQSDSLVVLKQYDSAFKLLTNADPTNDDTNIVLKKIDIASPSIQI